MLVLSSNEIYYASYLIARYSSWIEYLNDFLKVEGANGILCILYKLNCSDLLTRGMCSMIYRGSDIMNDQSFMNLYIYQIFLPFLWGRVNVKM